MFPRPKGGSYLSNNSLPASSPKKDGKKLKKVNKKKKIINFLSKS